MAVFSRDCASVWGTEFVLMQGTQVQYATAFVSLVWGVTEDGEVGLLKYGKPEQVWGAFQQVCIDNENVGFYDEVIYATSRFWDVDLLNRAIQGAAPDLLRSLAVPGATYAEIPAHPPQDYDSSPTLPRAPNPQWALVHEDVPRLQVYHHHLGERLPLTKAG